MPPTISIVITVYNRSRYLNAAIESVLQQTRHDFELIIWDDGSTDNSVDIARHYAKQDRRVRVVAAEHQGATRSLKDAFSMTTGTYVGWVDSDDILAPTALLETAAVLDANPEIGLVYTDYIVIDENNKVIASGKRCKIPYCKDRILVDFMTFHFRLIRRSVFEQAGGIDESCQLVQDYDICLRLSEVTQVQHLQQPLYYYRQHPQSITHQHTLELILSSKDAIARALQRRGLAERYEIKVEIVGHYYLQRKNINDCANG
ncbi:glycosyltransferase [Chlorogloeopsis sp. ULAP01]|uniref:glycosyltransferase n=1 Tax=Chlorogloeopsis sp. ULAP01 TaxID=3056483 RepID=UPI0025AB55B8|nr:glycosyltransferase [Chlorogloeopsis sp. ULAP01]MDM9384718.1 glycosyltransferase [Chlorogloeopsis sp. ULAP01]